jgi:RNA-directed DNA polymerase
MSKLTWNDINWTLVQGRISRQQRRVYKASIEKNKAKVHAIQRRIIDSLDAKLLAVRKVTTETKGSHENNMKFASQLKLDGKTRPIITTIEDRAKQMLAKLALEPEWEAIFESNSYGFRPGKSSYEAIATLLLALKGKSRYVLDVDIKKCFEKIDHEKLILKLSTFDRMKNQIKAWLKTDIMVGQSMEIISPLLSNIALHGLGDDIKEWYAKICYPNTSADKKAAIGFSRYADDFVITAPERKDIEAIETEIARWLDKEAGLEFSKAKKRIIHSTEGFEFLGFQIISIKKKKNEDDYKVKIHPSKKSKARLIKRIRKLIQENKSASSYSLIKILSSRIIGWANYFRYSQCIEDFTKLDSIIFNQIRAWVFRRKSKGLRSRTKLKDKYFPEGKKYLFRGKNYQNNWILNGKAFIKASKIEENFLPKMIWVGSANEN